MTTTKPSATVVAALIERAAPDGAWEFLACRRPADKARPRLWEFVGGKVEPGETPEEALIRECREELAVTVAPGPLFMEVDHDYPDLLVHLMLFRASIADGCPVLLEHSGICWMRAAEIPSFAFCPADEAILERIMDIHG